MLGHRLGRGLRRLWRIAYAIVGGAMALIGGILVAAGKAKANEISVVPPQTAETMRENVQWLKNQT